MFRFTIRDLLWLMMVVGMGVGWWTEHRALLLCRQHLNYAVTEANYANNRIVEMLRENDSKKTMRTQP